MYIVCDGAFSTRIILSVVFIVSLLPPPSFWTITAGLFGCAILFIVIFNSPTRLVFTTYISPGLLSLIIHRGRASSITVDALASNLIIGGEAGLEPVDPGGLFIVTV